MTRKFSERQRVQLRERFNELLREDKLDHSNDHKWLAHFQGAASAEAIAWRMFLAGITERNTPAKRRRRLEIAEVDGRR
jgi:hypothetical protein